MKNPKEQKGYKAGKKFSQRPQTKRLRNSDQVSHYIDEGNPNTQPAQTSTEQAPAPADDRGRTHPG